MSLVSVLLLIASGILCGVSANKVLPLGSVHGRVIDVVVGTVAAVVGGYTGAAMVLRPEFQGVAIVAGAYFVAIFVLAVARIILGIKSNSR